MNKIKQFGKFEQPILRLAEQLKEAGVFLDVVIAGGAVLLYHGLKSTIDIDGFFENNSDTQEIIEKIGDDFHLNSVDENGLKELWLNNDLMDFNTTPPLEILEDVFISTNLRLRIVPLEYVLVMKMISNRTKDLVDMAAIVKQLAITETSEVLALLKKYNKQHVDVSIILDVFYEAYGEEWIHNYYVTHEKEILALF